MRYATEVDGALQPKLTKHDRTILAALPGERDLSEWCGPWDPPYGPPRQGRVSVWQLAESLLNRDVAMVERTLLGLEHFGYARQYGCHTERRGRPRRWYRTRSGSAALSTNQSTTPEEA